MGRVGSSQQGEFPPVLWLSEIREQNHANFRNV